MSYLVLARKYRPRNFSEMVGQSHVVQALDNPSGMNTSALQPMPFIDRLLDAERFYSVPAE